jgi:hypothetical protein
MGLVKRYYLATVRHFLEPTEQTEQTLRALQKELARQNRPMKFPAVLIEHQREFEKLCATLEEHYHQRAADMTLYQFISRLETLKEKFKQQSTTTTPNGEPEPKPLP